MLVDEYQDTNRVQYQLVTQLASEHTNLCVVGDGDQSIYGWRGADVRNILDFERDYPDTQVVKLESNYRSTRAILEGASQVVAHNESSKGLKLRAERGEGELLRFFEAGDERAEAAFVVRQILNGAREGRSPREFAIFYRTNAQSRPFEEELLRYNVPYSIIGGVRFYERAEVKDALAYLRIALNPGRRRRVAPHRERAPARHRQDHRRASRRNRTARRRDPPRGSAAARGGRRRRSRSGADPRVRDAARGTRARHPHASARRDRSRTCSSAAGICAISKPRARPRPRRGSRTCANCSPPPRTSASRARRPARTIARRSSCSSTRWRWSPTSTAGTAAPSACR